MPRPSRYNDIVEAAAELFGEKGYHACSLEDIAARVGIWKGSIYHYIDTKEDLLLAVIRVPADRILVFLRQSSEADLPPSEKLRAVISNHIAVLHETFVYASVYLQEIAGRHRSDEWAAMDREYARTIEQIITDGIDDGSFDGRLDPRIAALSVLGSLNWLVRWYQPDGDLGPSEIADRMATLLLGGLLARSGTG